MSSLAPNLANQRSIDLGEQAFSLKTTLNSSAGNAPHSGGMAAEGDHNLGSSANFVPNMIDFQDGVSSTGDSVNKIFNVAGVDSMINLGNTFSMDLENVLSGLAPAVLRKEDMSLTMDNIRIGEGIGIPAGLGVKDGPSQALIAPRQAGG